MQRLGLLLAAVAALSGAQACQAFAGQCLGMVFGGEGQPLHVSGPHDGSFHQQQWTWHGDGIGHQGSWLRGPTGRRTAEGGAWRVQQQALLVSTHLPGPQA